MNIRKKILLAEDDSDLRNALAIFLEKSGHYVTQVPDGDFGQFMSLLLDFDLLITDIDMPEVDGVAMLTFIKDRLPVEVIVITGLSEKEAKLRLGNLCPHRIMCKPFPSEELLRAVQEIFTREN